jgi:hypothetical protein
VRKTRLIAWATAVIVTAAALVLYRGAWPQAEPHYDGACRDLPLEGGVDDIQLNPRGVAYLSTDTTVMLVDLNTAEPRPRAALAVEPADFRPQGIALFENRLFAIDRHEDGVSQILIFEPTVTGAFAAAGKPVRDSLLATPDAVRATGPHQFYVANEATKFWGNETVVYYDGTKMHPVTDGSTAAPVRGVSVTYGKRTLARRLGDRKLMLCQQ